MPDKSVKRPKNESLWIEGLKTIGLSLFLAFGVRAGVAQSFFIPSSSMEPTLKIGDLAIALLVEHFFASGS